MENENIVLKEGKYRHYKGHMYEVVGLATHSENNERLVVYRNLYGNFELWVRPLHMFLENVTVDGEDVPRFEFVGDASLCE